MKTILYYSSNREDEDFERRIQKTLLENSGDLPIISVTQKPVHLGLNICVGDVGASGFNVCRQILIGCKQAKTKYIVSAEADCIYPPDYFKFIPKRDDVCYRNTNTFIMGNKRDYFWQKKEGGIWAQVVNRKFYIKRLEELLKGQPEWNTEMKNFPKEIGKKLFNEFDHFTSDPCISFKTGNGMRHYSHSERVPIYNLPYWDNSKALRKHYYGH